MGADSSGNELTFKLNLNDQETLRRFQGQKPIKGTFNIDPSVLSQSKGEFKVNLSPSEKSTYELPKIKIKKKQKSSPNNRLNHMRAIS